MRRATVFALALTILGAAGSFAAEGKPRLAVLEFGHKALEANWSRAGEAAQDMFITELVQSGKYTVIDRERLDALMREKNLSLSGDIDPRSAVQAGKLLGVEYILFGNVTEFGEEVAKAKVGWGFGVDVKRKKFIGALDVRLVATTTGEILWADKARKEESNVNVLVFGSGGGVDDRRMFDKVLLPCVQELAGKMTQLTLATSASVKGKVSGKVAKVDGDVIWINLGSSHGVAVGDTFEVYRPGEPIKDPDTGEILGADEELIGSIKVTLVKGKSLSEATTVTGSGFRPGDVVK